MGCGGSKPDNASASAVAGKPNERHPANDVQLGQSELEQPNLRADLMRQITQDSANEDQEEDTAVGELPTIAQKRAASIRRATPQVQSLSGSITRPSRSGSSRSNSMASEIISE